MTLNVAEYWPQQSNKIKSCGAAEGQHKHNRPLALLVSVEEINRIHLGDFDFDRWIFPARKPDGRWHGAHSRRDGVGPSAAWYCPTHTKPGSRICETKSLYSKRI